MTIIRNNVATALRGAGYLDAFHPDEHTALPTTGSATSCVYLTGLVRKLLQLY